MACHSALPHPTAAAFATFCRSSISLFLVCNLLLLSFHSCPLHRYPAGKEYASNHLMNFLAIMSMMCDWTRRRTPDSGE